MTHMTPSLGKTLVWKGREADNRSHCLAALLSQLEQSLQGSEKHVVAPNWDSCVPSYIPQIYGACHPSTSAAIKRRFVNNSTTSSHHGTKSIGLTACPSDTGSCKCSTPTTIDNLSGSYVQSDFTRLSSFVLLPSVSSRTSIGDTRVDATPEPYLDDLHNHILALAQNDTEIVLSNVGAWLCELEAIVNEVESTRLAVAAYMASVLDLMGIDTGLRWDLAHVGAMHDEDSKGMSRVSSPAHPQMLTRPMGTESPASRYSGFEDFPVHYLRGHDEAPWMKLCLSRT